MSTVERVRLCRRGLCVAIGLLLTATACAHQLQRDEPEATLRTDSARYVVKLENGHYSATIRYVVENHRSRTLSRSVCGGPPPPALEKQLSDGSWKLAYSQVELLCETIPPFRIPGGGVYRGKLVVYAVRNGGGPLSPLTVDSVPGTYRLHWSLVDGDEPRAPKARRVEIISPLFRLATE
jgi:hypothetical protein